MIPLAIGSAIITLASPFLLAGWLVRALLPDCGDPAPTPTPTARIERFVEGGAP